MGGIDWTSARVEGGSLTVALTEEPSREWRDRLTAIIARLGHDGVSMDGKALTVEWVAPGTEADIRFLLEWAVLETNLAEEERAAGADADREMTEAFRDFA